jgi:hypothetical protein
MARYGVPGPGRALQAAGAWGQLSIKGSSMNSDQLRQTVAELRALANRIEGTIDAPAALPSLGITPKQTRYLRPVEAIDPATGEVVQRFASQADAARAGFIAPMISACLNGRAKQTGGYQWRWAA